MRTLIALGLAVAAALLLVWTPGGGAAEEPGSAVITWSQTGGFAGVQHTLRIGTARRVVARSNGTRSTMRLSRKRYARLRRLLDDAQLSTLKPRYPAPGAADTFQYSVGYRGSTVSADETKVPARLRPALAALGDVFSDATGRQRFQDPDRAALAAARTRWRRAELRSYRFRLRVLCFCPGAGRFRAIRVLDGKPHGGRGAERIVDTVPEMFRQIADAIGSGDAGEIDVRYDDKLGYPRAASVDRIEAAIDDEISWSADRLRPLGR